MNGKWLRRVGCTWLLGCGMAGAHTLVVTVRTAEGPSGEVRVALFGATGGFPDGRALARAKAALHKGTATVALSGINVSQVAVAAYLDRNGNGRLDRSWVGRPTEPCGFSNGATGTLGPPAFDAARIDLRRRQRITIILRGAR